MLTSNPTESHLMDVVCNNPADDVPRLAYANWVEQHDDKEGAARAEYIRRTIRAYRERNELEDYTSIELLTPERTTAWANGIRSLGVPVFHFVRGFVASAVADAQTFVANGSKIAACCPLQYVTIVRGAKPHLSELLNAPWMKHVFSLDFAQSDLTDADVTLLAESNLHGLRWVNLEGDSLTMKAAEEMAKATAAGRFPELHTLHLPLDIYDDVEGGIGMAPVQMTVFRPPNGERLRAQYGDLQWLTPRPPGFRGSLHA